MPVLLKGVKKSYFLHRQGVIFSGMAHEPAILSRYNAMAKGITIKCQENWN
jgi:hypothetical protein